MIISLPRQAAVAVRRARHGQVHLGAAAGAGPRLRLLWSWRLRHDAQPLRGPARRQPQHGHRQAEDLERSHFHFLHSNYFGCRITASPKVLKIFSHPQTRDQSQVVQNDKLSQESVETKIFVGGNGTFSHFFEKKLKKMWEKISKKKFFFTKIAKNQKKNAKQKVVHMLFLAQKNKF